MREIIFIINISILLAGIIVFVIGVKKAVRSRYCDLDRTIWCFTGNTMIVAATVIQTCL